MDKGSIELVKDVRVMVRLCVSGRTRRRTLAV